MENPENKELIKSYQLIIATDVCNVSLVNKANSFSDGI